jgi:hypothetical protein
LLLLLGAFWRLEGSAGLSVSGKRKNNRREMWKTHLETFKIELAKSFWDWVGGRCGRWIFLAAIHLMGRGLGGSLGEEAVERNVGHTAKYSSHFM